MDCKDSVQWISDWLDGALTPVEERMLMMHLEQCPQCAALWEQLTALHTACSDLPEISAPEGFVQGVMARVRETEQITSEPRKQKKVIPLFQRVHAQRWMAAVACFVVGFGLSRTGFFNNFDGTAQSVTAENAFIAAAEESAPMEMERIVASPQAAMIQNDVAELESEWTTDRAVEEAVGSVLVLEKLPEGSEAVLGKEIVWTRHENGEKSCFVTGKQGEQLLALAQEQKISIREEWELNPEYTVWEIRVITE